MEFSNLSKDQLLLISKDMQSRYEDIKRGNLSLDLTRGKPSPEQLDLSNELDGILEGFYLLQDGTDVRNYGGILGIPEARELGADILGTSVSETMVGGNSSLHLMYLYMDFALNQGVAGPDSAWIKEALETHSKVKFLCPVPGYDRHFKICEQLDIEMISIPILRQGPDMELAKKLVTRDPLIKGIWCVPKYSNPTAQTYGDESVKELSQLALVAGKDFRIMWDNAYAVHHLTDQPATLLNLMDECKKAGTADELVMLASTSKITFAGAGISFLSTSAANLAAFEQYLAGTTIGFDKVNQLRHVRFLKNSENLGHHMEKHRQLIRPKFDLVDKILTTNLAGKNIASWSKPKGGYFVSLDTLPGVASETIELAKEAGVKLTPAGSAFPYRSDPQDRNIRIAPTYPDQEQLRQALEVLVTCIQLASANHYLNS